MRKFTPREYFLLIVVLPVTFPFYGIATFEFQAFLFGLLAQAAVGLISIKSMDYVVDYSTIPSAGDKK